MCEAACGAISFLALRVPAHAKQLMQLGAGQAVVQAMKVHSKQKQLQVRIYFCLLRVVCKIVVLCNRDRALYKG